MIGSILGNAVLRTEDRRFLTGAATFVEDIAGRDALHAVFVRSYLAHARIRGIDASRARSSPGVVAVFTSADLGLPAMPSSLADELERPVLAHGVVRFVGEAVAVVIAETRAQAVDAAEAVFVDYEPLPVVATVGRAIEPDAPLLFPDWGSNVVRSTPAGKGRHRGAESHGEGAMAGEVGPPTIGEDVLADADVVVRGRFVNQRLAPVPMEVNATLAEPDAQSGGVTIWVPSQAPFFVRDDVIGPLGLKRDQVRVIAPAVGGGFGAKGDTYPETIVVACVALRLGRAVGWVESRSESMTAMVHGRAQVQDVELGMKHDGSITGLRARIMADMGAYPVGHYLPALTNRMASGVYLIPGIDFAYDCVVTNTTPVAAYRGAGRPEATAMIERVMDLAAGELHMDPAEIRRKNFIQPEEFPYTTPTGACYDVGDYSASMDEALRVAGYRDLRIEQDARRRAGDSRLLGIGLSSYVEVTGWGSEYASVEVCPDGSVTVLTGTSPHGQGHETAWAQIVEGTLGIPMDAVRVVHSDTRLVPRGEGTMGSRSLQLGGSAVLRASRAVLEKAKRIAAHLLEASPEDVVSFDGARVGVAGAPDRALSWAELAAAAADQDRLPEGTTPGLAAEDDFAPGNNTYPFGTHVAIVEVDTETGSVRLLRHVAVDDCGRILNPLLVDGQVHGGVAQGAAQALFEEVVFDEQANPLTADLMTYAIPSAADLPTFEVAHTETPTPLNPLGAKGIGESGTIGSTPAVQNAVIDAISHLGVRHLDMPATPERVWRAIREAGETR